MRSWQAWARSLSLLSKGPSTATSTLYRLINGGFSTAALCYQGQNRWERVSSFHIQFHITIWHLSQTYVTIHDPCKLPDSCSAQSAAALYRAPYLALAYSPQALGNFARRTLYQVTAQLAYTRRGAHA